MTLDVVLVKIYNWGHADKSEVVYNVKFIDQNNQTLFDEKHCEKISTKLSKFHPQLNKYTINLSN